MAGRLEPRRAAARAHRRSPWEGPVRCGRPPAKLGGSGNSVGFAGRSSRPGTGFCAEAQGRPRRPVRTALPLGFRGRSQRSRAARRCHPCAPPRSPRQASARVSCRGRAQARCGSVPVSNWSRPAGSSRLMSPASRLRCRCAIGQGPNRRFRAAGRRNIDSTAFVAVLISSVSRFQVRSSCPAVRSNPQLQRIRCPGGGCRGAAVPHEEARVEKQQSDNQESGGAPAGNPNPFTALGCLRRHAHKRRLRGGFGLAQKRRRRDGAGRFGHRGGFRRRLGGRGDGRSRLGLWGRGRPVRRHRRRRNLRNGLANGRGGIAARRDGHHLRARRSFGCRRRGRGGGRGAAMATLCCASSARAKGNSR